jgi:WD40 repeat protein
VFINALEQLYRWDLRGDEGEFRLGVKARMELRALHFDPEGKRLTYLTPAGTLGVLDWPGGSVRDTRWKTHHLALSPDGRWVATSNAAEEVVIYDFDTDREVLRLPPEGSDLWSLAWSADGRRLAVGTSDGGVALWDLEAVCARLQEFGLPVPQPPFRVNGPR